ncbi:TnsA endonuclease N-terminal domain-containing protein [Candidatus Marinarcus aquaticus]|uniref:Heteromeric transposase endonuclease subunit TnsA n=1 Tax=Candidatus Marinarcus aquaticus TaxID=2044504 RepID=A0A4Q0XP64_9BACT|nr:TnsA endonuclease N-terminal domain-containing protein [Candidatus Marinarcus aquaticus]RXJ54563.1 heteromeric transposase endonuclease subunit TnsA [Candidatus Marinarcus aquaticus]
MKIPLNRRKIGYTYGSTSGTYSFRSEKSIQFESLLEKKFLTTLEFNDIVLDVISQPLVIDYITANGNKSTYSPDFLVFFKDTNNIQRPPIKPLLVEVKPSNKLIENKDTLKLKFKAAIKFCNEVDYRFKIFNENRIESTQLKNIVFLNRYKEFRADLDYIELIKNHLLAVGHTTVEHLLTHLYVTDLQKSIALSHIWFLLHTKVILTDLNVLLNNNTVIWLNIEEENLGVEI